MPFSKSLTAYRDVLAVLTTVRQSGAVQGVYTLDTPGKATNFRARCYAYRNLLREKAREAIQRPGFNPTTEWDDMSFDHERGSCDVIIKVGQELGQLKIENKPVEIVELLVPPTGEAEQMLNLSDNLLPVPDLDEDRLMAEARDLIARKGAK